MKDRIIVFGEKGCPQFWQLLSAVQNGPLYRRDLAWDEFNHHIDTCPTCQKFEREIPPEYENEIEEAEYAHPL
jgi:hypothetical protein